MQVATLAKKIKYGTKLVARETGHTVKITACGTGPNYGWIWLEYEDTPENAHNRGLKRSMHLDILLDIYRIA